MEHYELLIIQIFRLAILVVLFYIVDQIASIVRRLNRNGRR